MAARGAHGSRSGRRGWPLAWAALKDFLPAYRAAQEQVKASTQRLAAATTGTWEAQSAAIALPRAQLQLALQAHGLVERP
ncbi:hypothetical protein ACN28S_67805 [Cystobacter fuscus]